MPLCLGSSPHPAWFCLSHLLHTLPPLWSSAHTLLFLQDPTNLDKFNVSNFFHVKNNLKVVDPGKYVWQGQCGCQGKLDPALW